MNAANNRFRFRGIAVLSMTVMWMLLWGSFSPVTFIGGVLLSYLITVIFPLPPIHTTGRPSLIGGLALLWFLIKNLVVSSVAVLRSALARNIDLKSAIVRIDVFGDDDLHQVQVAEVVSLIPGTVVVELVRSPRRLYLHVLDLPDEPDAVERIRRTVADLERTVLRAWGTPQQRAAFEQAQLHRRSSDPACEWEVEG